MSKKENISETNPRTESKENREEMELEWPEVEMLFNAREHLVQMEDHLGSMCVRFEKNKHELVSRINQVEEMLYKLADELKSKKGIDENLECTLQLPDNPEKNGSFLIVRKD